MDRDEFLKQLEANFPEAYAEINESEKGLLHCEVGAFRRWVEIQMEVGHAWNAEKALRFIERSLREAGFELSNAIEVSFIEDLALGEHKLEYQIIIKERAPKSILLKMAKLHEFWK